MRNPMTRFWAVLDGIFLHQKMSLSSYELRKARVLTFLHLFIAVFVLASLVLSLTVAPTDNLSLLSGLVTVIVCLIVFKKWGNFPISGNLVAAGFPASLIPTIMETGGLHSDNLLWLLITPLIAILFGNKMSGLFWLVALEIFTAYLFRLEIAAPTSLDEHFRNFPPAYFWVSYSLLFFVVVFLMFLFKIGQDEIVKDLRKNQEILKERERLLTENNEKHRQISEQLRKSNSELEAFAYAASHDLKEPLRMIGMYTTLLQRRMGPSLTGENIEFMGYVTDGVSRMQRMLDDLLLYSRIGHGNDGEQACDLNDVLFLVQNNLQVRIAEGEATVNFGAMPKIMARQTETIQLFQNLIGNALKFRKKDIKPTIEVNWVLDRDMAVFGIRDNGIGIAPEFQEKVFAIFQRLHGKGDYEGSGIGLATCKKIVANLGGDIWLRSELGVGTTFFFSIPTARLIGQDGLPIVREEVVG